MIVVGGVVEHAHREMFAIKSMGFVCRRVAVAAGSRRVGFALGRYWSVA